MATEEQQSIIDKIIEVIDNAIKPGSVTNQMVAKVFSFLNNELKNFFTPKINSMDKDIANLHNVKLDKEVFEEEVENLQAGIIFQDIEVQTVAALSTVQNPQDKWGVYVISEGKYYQYSAANQTWNRTPYRLIPSDVAKKVELTQLKAKVPETDFGVEDIDLSISDETGNDIAQFADGHIKTKNFDSRKIGTESIDDIESIDLSISDENENVIAQFVDGHFKTKNFDSKNIGTESKDDIKDIDFSISDENENDIAQFADGHIKTRNFDSRKIDSSFNNKLKGKTLSILGDSISTFTGWIYPGNRARYPQSNLLTDVNLTYWKKLLDKTGMKLGINESWAGSRVSWDGVTESTDIGANKHIASLTRIGHLGENGSPDIILVYAGTNDVGAGVSIGTFNKTSPKDYTESQIQNLPVSTFADAYRTLLIRLMYYYKYSKIIVMLPTYTNSYYSISSLENYNSIIMDMCNYFGIKIIDTRKADISIMNQSIFLPDGIHHNSNGMDLLFQTVYNEFINKLYI